jgi:hypothetical protein
LNKLFFYDIKLSNKDTTILFSFCKKHKNLLSFTNDEFLKPFVLNPFSPLFGFSTMYLAAAEERAHATGVGTIF